MSFPWAIHTNRRTYRKRDRARTALARLRRRSLRLFVLLAVSGVTPLAPSPVVRAEPAPGTLPGMGTITSGVGSFDRTANTLTINQDTQKISINWPSFNIGRDASVTFRQLDASSVALNRIFQGSASEIFGRLSANGQVYLLNQNGFIFGNGAVVDTHSLIASTLNMSDEVFNTIGLTEAINQGSGMAAFEHDATAGAMGLIKIEDGATLQSAEGGRIMIFAPTIENKGEINTPGGQAVLAASQDKVYLAVSDVPNLRGLLVEVDTGGDVSNIGKIIAERGNVSLIGHAVNQNGLVRATTAVDLNGSIRLVARDKVTVVGEVGDRELRASRTGTLTLGPGSMTEVAPDDTAATAADAQDQPASSIELMGHRITLESGARIVAPAGEVSITATKNPQTPGPANDITDNDSLFEMKSGSVIDVSGLASAVLPMERNVAAVELRGNELRDAPLQRGGPLYGETVYVDVREGTPLADISGQLAAIERPLDERLATGGTVTINSEGAVKTEAGATIDVSGGAVRYEDGFISTSKLVSQGKLYDIGEADPNRVYTGIFGTHTVEHRKWNVTRSYSTFGSLGTTRFEPGYIEGKDAGTVAINARQLDLQGTLRGETTAGRYQRLPPGTDLTGFMRQYHEAPLGGALTLGAADYSGLQDFTLGSLADLGAEGMNRLRVYVRGKITVAEDTHVALAPGGELKLEAGEAVELRGDITAAGGSVQLVADNLGGSVQVGGDARIDVSGQWVNDGVALNPGATPEGPAFIDGGDVSVMASDGVTLERGSVIAADGGAQLQRDGKLKVGSGGDIVISSKLDSPTSPMEAPELRLDGELHAYALYKGGSLSLTGGGFQIGGAPEATPAGALYLAPEFFQRGGFSRYNLTATHSGIVQAAGSTVTLSAQNLELQSGYRNRATGAAIGELTRLVSLPDYLRQPVSLSLALERSPHVAGTARVEIGRDAVIQAEPGATVALTSDTQLIVDGTIAAPAGDIRLTLTKPESENETVFDATQAIWLGSNARLLAGGHYQAQPDDDGLRHGTMHDAGSVTIAAERGYLIAGEGSRIDVSGTTQTVDVIQNSRILPVAVSGDAGRIDLLAAEGMVLNGELRGAAGSGEGAAGGTLSINLDASSRGGDSNRFPLYPTDPREIVLSSTGADTPAPGTAVPDELNGTARLDPAKVAAGGFDELALRVRTPNTFDQTQAAIRLEGNVDLAVARRLTLDAPVLISDGGDARLAAAHVQLGTSKAFYDTPVEPEGGDGSLRVQAQHVDLIGTLALRGFGLDAATEGAPVRIESTGDIRLIGGKEVSSDNTALIGRLNSAADVELRADQVYAATATDYTLSVPDGRITIRPGDSTAAAPLSAASRITLNAADIEQHGTLRAPFGEIALNAGKSLTLGEGSVTSVSGAGQLVPFGLTEAGTDWLYPLTDGTQKQFEASPEKNISLTAPQIALAPGSTLDVSGGGDLLAREFLPGPGGSRDILEAANAEGAFAIVPAQSNPFGSYDPFLSRGAPVGTGDTIHIAPGGPLPAGEYAMLPAGYALLPGAYLVTPQAKTAAPVPGQALTQPDGSSIVAGQRGIAGTGTRDSLWSAFRIENGTQVRNRAEYLESRADNFFADGGARLNRDAGRLVLDAGTALTLGGTLAQNTGGGRGSEVDIVGERLAVVDSYSGGDGRVELLDAGLNALNADSLMLGASRSEQDGEVTLTVRAKQVTVETGAELAAPEVLLAAKEQLTVAGGAGITAGDDGAEVGAVTSLKLDGDSALARVSSGEQVRVTRTADGNTGATLDIAAGAILDAARSITLDAAGSTTVDGELRTHGGSLGLGAARVSLGETQGVSDGLVLSNERLARLDARELALNSRSTIDLYGQVSLSDLDHVALDAGGLAGYHNAGQGVAIGADTIVLSNRSGAGFSGTPDGSGTLNLAAREVTLGEGEFAVRGFDSTTIAATEQVIAKPETDTAAQLHVAGDLTMQTARLTAGSGADVRIDTQDAAGAMAGAIALTAPAGGEPLAAVTDLGAKLEIAATAIDHATQIELPSGMVTLNATGAGGVNIADNASINVAGLDLAFADVTVGSPGGTVDLIADTGDVIVGAARIDVSGAASGGDAGALSVSAPNGMVQFDAKLQLAATAHEGNRAGSFALDARTLANTFSAVNAALNTAEFNDARHWRLRSGDIEVAAGDIVLAHDLQLAADAGRIDVRGKIDASGEQAGRVALYAGDDVSLHAGSVIDTHATGADEEGGRVTLGSTSGRLDLQAGATVDVAGTDETGARADTGMVHLRAEREGTNGVAINPIAASIAGAGRVDIEAYKTYSASSIDAGLIATIQGETTAFMANAATIENTLGADARFHLLPGVEIQSTGNLSLNTDWDLLGWRQGGEAGVLTLRAAGDLNINRTLSDGVALEAALDGLDMRDTVQAGASWSYRLAGGADLAGANPLSVANGAGDVNLAAGVKVRTGTGDIEIAAGRDLRLADSSAAIYTVGENRGTGSLPAFGDFSADVYKDLAYNADFLHHGGDIRISAGRDIHGADSHQLINEWLVRAGAEDVDILGQVEDLPASWAVDVGKFKQNVGALGGGDVTVTARGDINDLLVVIPTTGLPDGATGTAPAVAGGGDLRFEAGGDIRGGVFYLARGKAAISTGGSLTGATESGVLPVLALAEGQYTVRARKDLGIETVLNPTALSQDQQQGSSSYPFMAGESFFFTYAPDSAARLISIAGDITLRGDNTAMTNNFGILGSGETDSDNFAQSYYPGTLSARSLHGDIVVGSGMTLMPAAQGNLELLARHDIVSTNVNTVVQMSDTDPQLLPGVLVPAPGITEDMTNDLKLDHAATPVHLGDTGPARIVAQTGTIGSLPGSLNRLTFDIPKQTRISAGGDVRGLRLKLQHPNDGDISVVEAGGSVMFPTIRDSKGQISISESKADLFEIAGPGEFHVIAGKDVNLGGAEGIVSIGDQKNPALADDGASITVMAGLDPAPDYAGFIERYLVADDAYHERLAQFMTGLGAGATGVDAFKTLPPAQQRRFILEVFFSELRESGVAAVESKDYTRGFDAIKTLFPAGEYDGDVKSFLSRIYTLDGGDINLIVPGGLVNAGVASATGIDKDAGKLGIVVQRAGDINAFVRDDFLVNASRVFALDGGDILIWSSAGNIDAGKGAKTALSIPPPTTTYDKEGNAVVEFPPSISGSGIRGAVSTPGRAPGDTYLIAPLGVINAGDAGIGSAGNLTIAATAVIGADNIQVGGIAAGVPTDTGGLGAGLAGVGDIAASAGKMAEDATRGLAEQREAEQGYLSVEVTGFGGEEGGDVVNLRNRRKPGTP